MIIVLTSAKDNVFRERVVPALRRVRRGLEFKKVTFDKDDPDSLYIPEKGEVCIGMGQAVIEAMQYKGLLAKNKKLGKYRETPIRSEKGGYWIFTHDPGAIDIDITKEPEFKWDLVLADRFDRTKSLDAEIGEYKYVKDFSSIVKYIKRKYERTCKKVTVALDTETMGLFPQYKSKKIVTIQITAKKGTAHVVYMLGMSPERRKLIKKQLKWILNTKKVNLVGANLKYDLVWIRTKYGITCSNFYFDTLLAGSCLNENRSNSLSNHTKEYLPSLGGYDKHLEDNYDKGKMEDIPKEELLTYSGGDTDSCYQIAKIMRKELQGTSLQKFYFTILHPAARAFEEMEYHGLVADKARFMEVREIIQKETDRCTKELLNMLPRKLKIKHSNKDNLLTPAIIAEYLFTPYGLNLKPKQYTPATQNLPVEKRKPRTNKDHLMMFDSVPEAKKFVGLYKEMNQGQRAISTYIDGFLVDLRPDGRFHPTYNLFKGGMYEDSNGDDSGAVTGRLSAKNIAIQTLSKHVHKNKWAKLLRSCYTVPAGYILAGFDFSQGELRIGASLADEDTMIQAYRDGIDLHALTGAELNDLTLEETLALSTTDPDRFDSIRLAAKATNFGKLFGQQPKGFVDFARMGYGLNLTLQESEEIHEKFFKRYPKLPPWHTRYQRIAYEQGYIESPLGRVRHLPQIYSRNWAIRSKAERQAVNSPVQSTLSDMCIWAIALITQRYEPEDVCSCAMIHDQILMYIREDIYIEVLPEIKYIMENLPLKKEFDWDPPVKFIVDAEVGYDLSSLKKVKL